MTAIGSGELLNVNGIDYRIGECVDRTPEAIAALEALEQLVVARRVNADGSFTTMTTTEEPLIKPERPSDEVMGKDREARRAYYEAYDEYMRIEKTKVTVPAPPVAGRVKVTESNAYFYLRQLGTTTISILPYAHEGDPEHRLYRLEMADGTVPGTEQ